MSTLYTNQGSNKIIKYKYTEPLEPDENITSRCRILFSIKPYLIHRKNRFLKLEEKIKTTRMSTIYTNGGSIKMIKYEFTKL